MPPHFSILAALFALGLCVGSLANLGIYRLAWNARPMSPWWPPAPGAPPRRILDRVPVLGWLGLRREAALHGRGFWVRPMLVELLTGVGFAALYWWEVGNAGLLPPDFPRPLQPGMVRVLQMQCAAHLTLIWLMLVASLIDVDEKTIPDAITVPGTLIGLAMAAVLPWSRLPAVIVLVNGPRVFGFLHVAAPQPWPAWLNGHSHVEPLLLALACLWLWCLAILPGSWHTRHGYLRAVRICAARLARHWTTYAILAIGVTGSAAIAVVWRRDGPEWRALLSALVGMAAGGGLIWMVRIIGTAVMRREAMGFGDVTLMAMIGAFLGWQPMPVVFFLAPLSAVVVGLSLWILRRESEIFFGPFLCLGALVTIVFWHRIWDYSQDIFAMGWFVPAAMVVCMGLMAVLLPVVRWVLAALR